MHGETLVTTEKVVCLSAVPDDAVIGRLESWADEHSLAVAVGALGESLPVGATDDPDRTLGVAVGGDGTFLETVRALSPHGIPVAGVNRGTLAFLSRIPPERVTDAMSEILRGEAQVFERQQLRITGTGLDATAINDVTLEPQATVDERPTCQLQVFVDDEYVGTYDGGGLCVSTPTGSTAMALSAGGPVHHPANNETLQLTDLHHDGLGVRAVVFDADRVVSVIPTGASTVWVDGGRTVKTLQPGKRLRVTGSPRRARVVRTSHEEPFLAALAAKLGWAIRDRTQPTFEPPVHPRGIDLSWSATELDTPVPDDVPSQAVSVAIGAVSAAGEFLERYFQRITRTTDQQRRQTLVSEADQGSERILTASIASAFPDHAIQCEERVRYRGQSTYTWLFDPVDGHTNFEHGNPSYCTTIALLESGVPVVGVVYAPEADELFHGIRGSGAYRNDAPIEPTDRDRLDESMLLSGYDPDGQFLETFYHHTRGVRRLGSQALNLCYVAAGSADALWEYDTYPWDVAAGLCILRAAGGRASDAEGADYHLRLTGGGRTPLLVSNGPLHPRLLGLLARGI